MVDEVVASQDFDPIAVTGQVGGGDGDGLPSTACCGKGGGAAQQIGRIGGEQCRGDQSGDVVTAASSVDDLGDGGGVTHGELVDHVFGVSGHRWSVGATPDTGLTRGFGRTLRW